VRGVIKRGQAHDASNSSRPTKMTAVSRKVMEGIVDNNGRLPLGILPRKQMKVLLKTLGYKQLTSFSKVHSFS
jgi:hypothetical protein